MSNKKLIKKIYFKALKEVLPKTFVKKNVAKHLHQKLYIFCVGKAAYDTAKECEKIFGDNIKGGVVVSLKKKKLRYLHHITSTHPDISKQSIKAAEMIINEAKKMKKDDLFLFFLSGGASAMIEKPKSIGLKKLQTKTSKLLKSGIDIKKLNQIRKSFSKIKDGKLAKYFPKNGYVYVLSDVLGDDLHTIGSAVMYNAKLSHKIVASNDIALKAGENYIKNKVQKTTIFSQSLQGSVQSCANEITKQIKIYEKKFHSYCLIFGGESYSKVKADGIGGRNQELALRLLEKKCIAKDTIILCAGTDGIDGNSKSNGAFLDSEIFQKIKQKGLCSKTYLNNSDSNTFFTKLGYDFTIGQTGTNVMDMVIVLKGTSKKKDK